MLAIIISRNFDSYDLPKSRKYDFPKCKQSQFPEMLAIIISRSTGKSNFPKCQQSYSQKCWRQMLAIKWFEMATNVNNSNFQNFQQLQFPEMLATNVSKYSFQKYQRRMFSYSNFQKCWRDMLPIRISINTGDRCQQL